MAAVAAPCGVEGGPRAKRTPACARVRELDAAGMKAATTSSEVTRREPTFADLMAELRR